MALRHSFPLASDIRAFVDVRLLLESLKNRETEVGQWVNVLGYVTSITKATRTHRKSSGVAGVKVQALVLWLADDLDIAAYETSAVKPAV